MMDSAKSLSPKERIFVICNVVLGAILLSTAVLSSSGRRGQREDLLPTTKDSTGVLKFLSQEIIDRRFEVKVQNASNKVITAYATAACDFPESSTDYSIGDYSIGPGEVFKINIPVKTVVDHCDPAKTQPTITIVSVVFDDRSYAGEFRWAKGILDDRRGNRIQLKRINVLLTRALMGANVTEPDMFERLKNEIASLPIDEREPPAVRGGLSSAKQRALYMLDELDQWHQKSLITQSLENIPIREELAGIKNFKEGLYKLISLNEKRINRF